MSTASTGQPGDAAGAASPLPAAVLWDMDGTLVDTEPYWMDTEFAIAERYGATWSREHGLSLVGSALLDSGAYIKEVMRLSLSPAEIVELLLDGVVERVQQHVPWCPGATELLGATQASGVPNALVTMSWQRFVDPVLAALPAGTFSTVITGDQVSQGKPHPEPYLLAASRLGVAPADCLAVEDSETGARSAAAAGCRVVVVPNHVPVPASPQWARLDGGLADVTLEDLMAASRQLGS